MKLPSLLSLLVIPSLAWAAAVAVVPRQAPDPITIVSLSASGTGCPPGTFTSTISPDGSTLLIGFGDYQTSVFPGSDPADREKFCNVFVTARYPVGGCRAATYDATSHGFALLEAGVSGTALASYSLSPGTIVSGSQSPATVLTSAQFADGDVYTKQDVLVTRATINNQNQRDVSFVVRSRVFLQAANQQAFGTVSVDDLSVNIQDQASC